MDIEYSLHNNSGTITLSIKDNEIIRKNMNIIVTCDRSGSMSPNFENLQFCMKNLVHYIYELVNEDHEINIYLSLIMFDNKISYLSRKQHINHSSFNKKELKKLICKICDIYARGSTNYERAFEAISDCIINTDDVTHCEDKDAFIDSLANIHIFMTDGAPTSGSKNEDELFNLLPTNFEHYFLGFGNCHKYNMLYNFSKRASSNSQYYFIDNIENAGLIYGEILDKVLYRLFDKCRINSVGDNILFYNTSNNTWDKNIFINSMGNGDKFTYHFKYIDHDEVAHAGAGADVYADADGYSIPYLYLDYHDCLNNYNRIQPITFTTENLSITGLNNRVLSKLRIDVLNEMYTSITNKTIYPENIAILRERLNDFEENQSRGQTASENPYCKQLQDDLYIMLNTFDKNIVYTLIRFLSQAHQLSYNITNIVIDDDHNYDQGTADVIDYHYQQMFGGSFSVNDPQLRAQPNSLSDNYRLSQDPYSAYSTPNRQITMRSVSGGIGTGSISY